MPALMTVNGARLVLQAFCRKRHVPMQVRLYGDDVYPTQYMARHNFLEIEGHGYAPKELNPSHWNLDPDHPTAYYSEVVRWEVSGPIGEVYGYFITDPNGDLIAAERFLNRYESRSSGQLSLNVGMTMRI